MNGKATLGRVFISYSHNDQEWAKEFASSLRARGVDVWFDLWSIAPGEPISTAIEQGLRNSDAIVILLTSERARRPTEFFELGAALGLGKRIVPIVASDVELADVPPPFRARRFLKKESPEDTADELLAEETLRQSA
jgi:hypothetical protein